jgi:hypothetical protein
MRRGTLVAMMIFGLTGCHSGQDKQFAACLAQARAETGKFHYKAPAAEGNITSMCMHRHGYDFTLTPSCVNAFSLPASGAGNGQLVLLNRRATSPLCYQPAK